MIRGLCMRRNHTFQETCGIGGLAMGTIYSMCVPAAWIAHNFPGRGGKRTGGAALENAAVLPFFEARSVQSRYAQEKNAFIPCPTPLPFAWKKILTKLRHGFHRK